MSNNLVRYCSLKICTRLLLIKNQRFIKFYLNMLIILFYKDFVLIPLIARQTNIDKKIFTSN